MELLFYLGKFIVLATLLGTVFQAYRLLWKSLSVAPLVGTSSETRFSDVDPAQLFWVVPTEGTGTALKADGFPCHGEILFGRSEECQVRLDDPFISQKHLRLTPLSDSCLLADLGTANGTRVGSNTLQGEMEIEEGQCFSIGDVTFRLVRRPV